MSGNIIKAKHIKHDVTKDFFERIIELVQDDKELHDAIVRMMDAHTDLQKAQAERIREKVKKGDL